MTGPFDENWDLNFQASLPLDVAAHARLLNRRRRPPSQHGVHGLRQVRRRDRLPVSRPRIIHLPAVRQFPVLGVEEEIRRARRLVRLRDLLTFVEEVRELVAPPTPLHLHRLGRVVGIVDGVVGVDADDGNALVHVLARHLRQVVGDVLDVGAMVAEEDDEQRLAVEVLQAHRAALGVGQREVRGLRAQGDHRGRGEDHGARFQGGHLNVGVVSAATTSRPRAGEAASRSPRRG